MSGGLAWPDRPGLVRVDPGDTRFWQALWKTDAFRALVEDPATGYGALLARAALRPWWWVPAEQPHERRHFSTWFGQAIVQRHYDNPFVVDLYHWHDILHAMTLPLGPFSSPAQWRLGMRANEIAVSMETELLLYWRHPQARSGSFDFPIWSDDLGPPLRPDLRARRLRFVVQARQDTAFGRQERALRRAVPASWPLPWVAPANSDRLDWEGLWALRRAITHWPDLSRATEQAMAAYEAQSDPFYDAWQGHWQEVEAERLAFELACQDGRWHQAVARREALWRRRADGDGVPYGAVARGLMPAGG